jgi:hypothetical protein
MVVIDEVIKDAPLAGLIRIRPGAEVASKTLDAARIGAANSTLSVPGRFSKSRQRTSKKR